MKKIARLLSGIALSSTMLSAVPAHAGGVPVIDPTAIARIRETVSVATKQLGAVQQQVQQVTQMRNTIGQVGPGMLNNMLQKSGLDFSAAQGVLKDVSSMSSQVTNLSSTAKSLALSGESMNFGSIKDLTSGREAAAQLFFYNGSNPMDQKTIGLLRERRNALVRDSAIGGYGAAVAMKGDMAKTTQIADNLSAQAKDATDLRGDVQANTATMLALLGEVSKQTALQAQMLEMQSAQALSGDSIGQRKK